MVFEDKFELSLLQFSRFWMSAAALRRIFGDFESVPGGLVVGEVQLCSEVLWENVVSENIYCLVSGTSAELWKELILVEAFYDSTAQVAGLSPGADEAVGAATLLQLARFLKENPPERTVLLAATSGHAQTLAGLRELVWSFAARSRDVRDAKNDLRRLVKKSRLTLRALKASASMRRRPSAKARLRTPGPPTTRPGRRSAAKTRILCSKRPWRNDSRPTPTWCPTGSSSCAWPSTAATPSTSRSSPPSGRPCGG
jgi:hypothetical protein